MKEHYGVEEKHLQPSLSNLFCTRDFHDPYRCGAFAKRLSVAFSIFFFGLYVNNVSQAWLQQQMAGYYETRWPPNATMVAEGQMKANKSVTLWDVTYYHLPMVKTTKYADIFAGGVTYVTFFRFVVAPGPYSMRWTILRRLVTCWGILWFCRAFTIVVTPLPNPDHTCVPKITFPGNIWVEAAANLPISPYHEMTCLDVMYSGHTVALTLNMLFFLHYSRSAPWFECATKENYISGRMLLHICGVIVTLTGYYFIVASHFHYTLDVLVGALVTYSVFKGYHMAIETAWIDHGKCCTISPFLRWYEKEAKDLRLFRSTMSILLQEGDHNVELVAGA